jgi:hypothetical protein
MFKNLLPVLLALSALPAGATTTFYVGATGPTGLAGFTSDLLTRGLTVGSMINFTGESSGTNVLDVGGSQLYGFLKYARGRPLSNQFHPHSQRGQRSASDQHALQRLCDRYVHSGNCDGQNLDVWTFWWNHYA